MSLTVTGVRLSTVQLDLVHEFETSSHRKGHLRHIIVRATATDGEQDYVGWGECASPTDPYYCAECTESCWHVLERYLVPMLLGRSWDTPQQAAGLYDSVTGNNFARAGIEMACWDIFAQACGIPLARALTTSPASSVDSGVSLGIESEIDDLLAQVAGHVADGYRRIKLKIRPGWDVEPARAVRHAFPDIDLQVDANAAYSPQCSDAFAAMDDLGLLMVEQPYAPDDLLSHSALARRLDTPVCLDESITSRAALETALALEACSVVNIKVSRLGGLAPAVAVHDVCLAAGIPAWCGGMHEFGIGRAANLALASLPGFRLPSDVSGSDKYYRPDIVSPPIRATTGVVPVPLDHPGIGVTMDVEVLERSTVATKEFRSPANDEGGTAQ